MPCCCLTQIAPWRKLKAGSPAINTAAPLTSFHTSYSLALFPERIKWTSCTVWKKYCTVRFKMFDHLNMFYIVQIRRTCKVFAFNVTYSVLESLILRCGFPDQTSVGRGEDTIERVLLDWELSAPRVKQESYVSEFEKVPFSAKQEGNSAGKPMHEAGLLFYITAFSGDQVTHTADPMCWWNTSHHCRNCNGNKDVADLPCASVLALTWQRKASPN